MIDTFHPRAIRCDSRVNQGRSLSPDVGKILKRTISFDGLAPRSPEEKQKNMHHLPNTNAALPFLSNRSVDAIDRGSRLSQISVSVLQRARKGLVIASVALGFCVNVAFAQDSGPVAVTLKAELIKMSEDGKEERLPAEKAEPGDIVLYTATCKNTSPRVITELKPVIPIPAEMEFQESSAHPEAAEGSLNGTQFASMPLEHEVKQDDGTVKAEPVPSASYRAMRWTIAELKPEETAEVSLRVRVKATAATPATSPAK